jgi:FKBP-type peptidyl-prolyl cis-trans isomerase FkpA
MLKKSLILLILIVVISTSLFSQNDSIRKISFPDFNISKTALCYKTLSKGITDVKAKTGDLLVIGMLYKTVSDSVLYNSFTDPRTKDKPIRIVLENSLYRGDLFEALSILNLGDSSAFIISADSFFMKSLKFTELPPFLKKGSDLVFVIKLYDIIDKDILEKLKLENAELMKKEEQLIIKKYLRDNKIKVKPTVSGLYNIKTQKGKGPNAQIGDIIFVHYTGKFIDGTTFDSSIGKSPYIFVLGAGNTIKGWEEGILKMKKGGKSTIIIPSSLGYGENGYSQIIPPYTPLIFELEIVDIKKVNK